MHTRLHGADSTTPTFMELQRLDAERRLRFMPRAMSESSWAIEAQREAAIDALLAATTQSDERAYAHARHVGEWCARIAAQLPQAPTPAFMRRCGVLAGVDAAVVERVPHVEEFAHMVRAFQRSAGTDEGIGVAIIMVADEFDRLVCAIPEERILPNEALRVMVRRADARRRPIVEALRCAFHATVTTRAAGSLGSARFVAHRGGGRNRL